MRAVSAGGKHHRQRVVGCASSWAHRAVEGGGQMRKHSRERERELRLEVEGLLPSLSGKGERVGDITEEVRVQADIQEFRYQFNRE